MYVCVCAHTRARVHAHTYIRTHTTLMKNTGPATDCNTLHNRTLSLNAIQNTQADISSLTLSKWAQTCTYMLYSMSSVLTLSATCNCIKKKNVTGNSH